MAEQIHTIQDDVAYIKALATAGRRAPLIGGAIALSTGLIYGLASLACWTIQRQLVGVPLDWAGWIWAIAFLAQLAALGLLVSRVRRKPGAMALSNRAVAAAWQGAGSASFVLAMGTLYLNIRYHSWLPWAAFAAVVLALYGLCWTVSSAMSEAKWMRWTGLGSFLGAGALLVSIGSGYEFLIYGAALLLLVALPGWIIMRGEPAEPV